MHDSRSLALSLPALGLAAALLAPPAAAQPTFLTVPADAPTSNGNSSTIFPFAESIAAERYQWGYDPSLLGAPGPIVITEISIRANQNNLGLDAFCFPSLQVTLASGPQPIGLLTNADLESNLGPDAVVVREPLPWKGGPVPPTPTPPFVSPWVPLGIARPFVFDPTTAPCLIIDVQVCGKTQLWSQGMDGENVSSLLGRTFASTVGCTSLAGNSTLTGFVPVIRVDYHPVVPQWQPNTPQAHLDIDGGSDVPNGPLEVQKGLGQSVTLNWSSTLSNQPCLLAINAAPAASALGAGAVTGGGQFLNLDLSKPTIWFPGAFGAGGGSQSLPATPPAPIPPIAMQLFVAEPANPDGFRISGACQLEILEGCE